MMFFTKKRSKPLPVETANREGPSNTAALFAGLSIAEGSQVNVAQFMSGMVGIGGSAEEIARSLKLRMLRVAEAMAARNGLESVGGDTDGEPFLALTVDRARSTLPALMSNVRESLVAFISKQGKAEEAVALVDWRALDMVLGLAEESLRSTTTFGDLMPVRFTSEQAAQLAGRDFNRPLAVRQSAADRVKAIAAMMDGTGEEMAWPVSS